jgi:hypothetical protein
MRLRDIPIRMVTKGDRCIAYFAETLLCKSSHCCPVCSPWICQQAIAAIKEAVARWVSASGQIVNVTLTIRHQPHHALAEQVELISTARARFTEGSKWRRVKKTLGIKHIITAHDVTHSRSNGWHKHLHCTFFIDSDSASASEELRALALTELSEHWIASVARALKQLGVAERTWPQYLPSVARGLRWKTAGQGDYLVKLPNTGDVAQARRPDGRRNNWEIMADASTGDPESQTLWATYTDAMCGETHVCGLGKLKRALGCSSAINATDTAAEHATIAMLPGAIYDEVSRMPGGRPRTIQGAERGGLRGGLRGALRGAATVVASIRRERWTWDPSPSQSRIRLFESLLDPTGQCSRRRARLRRAGEIAVARHRRRMSIERVAVQRFVGANELSQPSRRRLAQPASEACADVTADAVIAGEMDMSAGVAFATDMDNVAEVERMSWADGIARATGISLAAGVALTVGVTLSAGAAITDAVVLTAGAALVALAVLVSTAAEAPRADGAVSTAAATGFHRQFDAERYTAIARPVARGPPDGPASESSNGRGIPRYA